jgi:hypothetical protein
MNGGLARFGGRLWSFEGTNSRICWIGLRKKIRGEDNCALYNTRTVCVPTYWRLILS